MEGFGGPAHPSLAIAQCLDGDTQMEPRGLERFMGRQLGFVCAWRVSGARGSRLDPAPPSVGGSVRRPQQIPRAGAVSLISAIGPKFWSRGTTAIAAVRWLLATVLVAVAVAIVGVVVLRGGALVNLRCPCSF
jgi:hypothetical protein